jgi:hypothetical protein
MRDRQQRMGGDVVDVVVGDVPNLPSAAFLQRRWTRRRGTVLDVRRIGAAFEPAFVAHFVTLRLIMQADEAKRCGDIHAVRRRPLNFSPL